MFTKGRRGFSLTEILVVAGLLSLCLSAWLFMRSNAAAIDHSDTLEQEFHQAQALLQAKVKQDLRSCLSFREDPPGQFTLQILAPNDAGTPVETTVIYQVSSDRRKVERKLGTRRDVYDFSRFLGSKSYVFRITP